MRRPSAHLHVRQRSCGPEGHPAQTWHQSTPAGRPSIDARAPATSNTGGQTPEMRWDGRRLISIKRSPLDQTDALESVAAAIMGAAVLTAIGDVGFPDQLCQRDSQFVAQPNIQKPGLERSSDGQSCASTRNPTDPRASSAIACFRQNREGSAIASNANSPSSARDHVADPCEVSICTCAKPANAHNRTSEANIIFHRPSLGTAGRGQSAWHLEIPPFGCSFHHSGRFAQAPHGFGGKRERPH